MENKGPYYITTAIAYTSGKPHIGNTYEVILADAIARYKRKEGYDVYFQTGTDEHGQKIEEKAKAAGLEPKEFVDKTAGEVKRIWDLMDTSYDRFIRTTDPDHVKETQKIFQKMYDNGDIYKGSYEGWYCKECEAFYTSSEVKEEGICPECGQKLEKASEEAYFFRMSKYADRLMKYIDEHPEFIQPESRKNEMVNNFLKPGLQDLCVSRTSFTWGIPVPFDPKHVIYVWIDALSNYITGIGYDTEHPSEKFKKYWPADVHLIGKDILRFHTIYWPIMLMSLGLPLPKQVFGHPWLLMNGSKMSKSLGNVIYADDLVRLFGVDAVRYFVLHETPFAQDGNITWELVTERVNSDLANTLGNLVSRTISMSNKYFDGEIKLPEHPEEFAQPVDEEVKKLALAAPGKISAKMDELRIADSLDVIFELLRRLNKYVDETEPWKLGKDPEQKDRLAVVLYNLLEGIRFAAVLLEPYLPQTAKKIYAALDTKQTDFDSLQTWGALEQDRHVAAKIEPLFKRLDLKEVIAAAEDLQPVKPEEKPVEHDAEINADEFGKVELRVGTIKECRKHPKADKLLIEKIDLGHGEIRQIVSGIAGSYKPEELIGKKAVVVCNLKPAKIRGEESQGMLLAGKDGENIRIVSVDLPDGTRIQ